MLTAKIGAGIGLAAALLLGASPALAAGWTVVLAPPNGQNANLRGVSAPSDTSAWAVGNSGGAANTGLGSHALIDHWNGSAWSVVPMPLVSGSDTLLAYEFSSVDAISPTNVWAVGGSGDHVIGIGGSPSNTLIEHYNGTAWSIVPSPSPGTNNALTGVTESAPNNLWAVGYGTPAGAASAQTLTLNWNGTAWATVTSPNQGSPSVLTSVSTAPGDAIVWAAGYSGTTGSFNPLILQNG